MVLHEWNLSASLPSVQSKGEAASDIVPKELQLLQRYLKKEPIRVKTSIKLPIIRNATAARPTKQKISRLRSRFGRDTKLGISRQTVPANLRGRSGGVLHSTLYREPTRDITIPSEFAKSFKDVIQILELESLPLPSPPNTKPFEKTSILEEPIAERQVVITEPPELRGSRFNVTSYRHLASREREQRHKLTRHTTRTSLLGSRQPTMVSATQTAMETPDIQNDQLPQSTIDEDDFDIEVVDFSPQPPSTPRATDVWEVSGGADLLSDDDEELINLATSRAQSVRAPTSHSEQLAAVPDAAVPDAAAPDAAVPDAAAENTQPSDEAKISRVAAPRSSRTSRVSFRPVELEKNDYGEVVIKRGQSEMSSRTPSLVMLFGRGGPTPIPPTPWYVYTPDLHDLFYPNEYRLIRDEDGEVCFIHRVETSVAKSWLGWYKDETKKSNLRAFEHSDDEYEAIAPQLSREIQESPRPAEHASLSAAELPVCAAVFRGFYEPPVCLHALLDEGTSGLENKKPKRRFVVVDEYFKPSVEASTNCPTPGADSSEKRLLGSGMTSKPTSARRSKSQKNKSDEDRRKDEINKMNNKRVYGHRKKKGCTKLVSESEPSSDESAS